MGLKQRNGKLYYYRKRREGSRVVSEYAGSGVVAFLSEYIDRREREQQQAEREREIAYSTSVLELESQFDDLDRFVDLVVKAFYISEGYHQHKRQWRKMRNFQSININGGKGDMSANTKSIKNELVPNEMTLENAKALEQKLGRLVVEAGRDVKKVPEVKSFIAANPWIFDYVSILGPTMQKALMIKMFSDNEAAILVAEGEYRAMIARHTSEGSTAVEKMLIERIGMGWLRVNYAELALAALTRAKSSVLSFVHTSFKVSTAFDACCCN